MPLENLVWRVKNAREARGNYRLDQNLQRKERLGFWVWDWMEAETK